MIRTHWGQHDVSCYGCKLASIQFGNVEAPPQRAMEANLFTKDRDAYYRLRTQHGLQPRHIRGCDELEARANMPREVEEGRIISKQAWREAGNMIEDAEAIVKECSLKPNSGQAKEAGERFRAARATAS